MTRSIVFLTDFGYRNEWVGICHAVVDKIAPGVNVVDLSHGVPPLDVRAGALELADSLPYVRHDAVVLAVVDPSVGRDLDIALRTGDGRLLVGLTTACLLPRSRVRRDRGSGLDHVVGGPARARGPVLPCPGRACTCGGAPRGGRGAR
jgi:SAM hydroxide adenosyltransferase N-terminal domain